MAYLATNEDYDLLRNRVKTIYARIELLDKDMNVIDQLEGITMDGSVAIDADSDIRRTFSSKIYLDKSSAISKYEESELINKYLHVYIGLRSSLVTKWYSLGLFAFSENGYTFSQEENSLSVSCVDLTAKLNDTLAGQLTGLQTKITEGSSIRNAIISTVELGGFTKCMVDYWNRTVPYDLEYDTGVSVWEILAELRDLYYPFEMYFDEDTFVCKQIPDGYEDPVVLQDNVLRDFVIEEQSNVDYSQVRNCVEVFGASSSADYYCDNVSYANGQYTLRVDGASVTSSKKFSFLSPVDNQQNCTVLIISTIDGQEQTAGPYPLYYGVDVNTGEDKTLQGGVMKAGKYYVIKHDTRQKKFYYIGQQQTHAMVMLMDHVPDSATLEQMKKDENCDNLKVIGTQDSSETDDLYKSRFSIDRIGRRNLILSGGDYENYTTDEGCMEVAQYEHWKRCRLTDTLTLKTAIIPWLDVNQKVSYKANYLNMKEAVQWIVKNITIELSEGTMNITMARYYPYYPFIVQNKY